MKKIILPNDYKEKIKLAIEDNDISIACSFVPFFNFAIKNHNKNQLYPGQISLSKDVMEWLLNVQKEFEEYTDITSKEWKLLLLQKGPSINNNLEARTVLFYETIDEVRKEKYNKNLSGIEKIYVDYKILGSSLELIEKAGDNNEETDIA